MELEQKLNEEFIDRDILEAKRKKDLSQLKTESVEDFLARGGEIQKLETPRENVDSTKGIRFEEVGVYQTAHKLHCLSEECLSRFKAKKYRDQPQLNDVHGRNHVGKSVLMGKVYQTEVPIQQCDYCESLLLIETKRELVRTKLEPVSDEKARFSERRDGEAEK